MRIMAPSYDDLPEDGYEEEEEEIDFSGESVSVLSTT